ncbi:hypothetical protein [Yimella sp. cx-51]|uniref:hypothetical protein n=1 Tax=Yimella sp. cx-51 TaxID=2770551 RepID=UPI00165E7DDB|nr:hypothetical protein [Yimella sp. cx-51]MBC9956050.1 hypothetical protein [Yimella sp. cx-51]QTH37415.1 hypothetical protein J5M86_11090 [Yimella sp. cx-51]
MTDARTVLPRSAVSWLVVGDQTWPVWHAVVDSRIYVIGGPGEQPVPELPEQLQVILRTKDTRAKVGPVPARALRLHPGVPAWQPAVDALLAARQGVPSEALLDRWKARCAVWAIDIDLDAHLPRPAPDEHSGARVAAATTATTDRWRPRHLGRPRRRR